jgi:hypothetical protein
MASGQDLKVATSSGGTPFLAALALVIFSYLLFVGSVHTYCENRPFAGVLVVASLADGYFLIRRWPIGVLRRVLSVIGTVLCLLSLAWNIFFIAWATHTCRHMFDLLNK